MAIEIKFWSPVKAGSSGMATKEELGAMASLLPRGFFMRKYRTFFRGAVVYNLCKNSAHIT